ncbi:MAG: hypothetical protein SOV62_06990 [Alloprevotella sp.]|nr:hypothetical protein [Alloprevotella sp.]
MQSMVLKLCICFVVATTKETTSPRLMPAGKIKTLERLTTLKGMKE